MKRRWNVPWDTVLLIAVILWTVFFDALRDGFADHPDWWMRHVFKWLQFYPILIYVIWRFLNWRWWLILPLPCWALWQFALRCIAGKDWESMWIRWIKALWDWIFGSGI